jgi:hypothetical protein
MKRIVFTGLAVTVFAGLLALPAAAQQEPLGDYARSVRKEKVEEKPVPAARTFDNDNLPKDDALSVVGPAAEAAPQDGQATGAQPAPDKEAASAAAEQKKYDGWKAKIADQKQQIDLLSRELDVLQRESRLRAAAFYSDAGNRLRNSAAWDKEQRQYQDQIAQKQKAVDDAKKQLDDMQEQARKAGVPASMRD